MCLSGIWNWLGTNTAEIIASCALVFTTYQAYLSRKHNRISVRPKLALQAERNSQNHTGSIIINLSNSGLGPAEINSYTLELDGKEQSFKNSTEALDWIRNLVGIIEQKSAIYSIIPGHVLSINESIIILHLDFMEDGENGWDLIEKLMNRISLTVQCMVKNLNITQCETHEKFA